MDSFFFCFFERGWWVDSVGAAADDDAQGCFLGFRGMIRGGWVVFSDCWFRRYGLSEDFFFFWFLYRVATGVHRGFSERKEWCTGFHVRVLDDLAAGSEHRRVKCNRIRTDQFYCVVCWHLFRYIWIGALRPNELSASSRSDIHWLLANACQTNTLVFSILDVDPDTVVERRHGIQNHVFAEINPLSDDSSALSVSHYQVWHIEQRIRWLGERIPAKFQFCIEQCMLRTFRSRSAI